MLFLSKFSSQEDLKLAMQSVNFHPGKLRRFFRKLYWAFFIYYFRKHHISTVLTRNGLLSYESRDRTVGRILEVYRHFDLQSHLDVTEFMRKIGAADKMHDGTVVDVGGFIGMSSITFMHENMFSDAIAFEPNPASFELLRRNVTDNFMNNRIKFFNLALSDASGSLDFELSSSNYGDHRVRNSSDNLVNYYGEDSRKIISVKSTAFDRFIYADPAIHPERIRLIWMDIQGHEGRFLQGAKKFISSHPDVPTIMEFWPYGILRSGITKEEFLKLVKDIYSSYYYFDSNGFVDHDISELDSLFDELRDPYIWGTLYLYNKNPASNIV